MWGVVFEIDVRLTLPLDSNGNSKDPDLGEDVYGPFHGQVCLLVNGLRLECHLGDDSCQILLSSSHHGSLSPPR